MKHRKSKLQNQILDSLKDYQWKNQAEISRLIKAHPSSVSRSIKKLVEQGAVVKKGAEYKKRGVTIEDLTVRSGDSKVTEIYPKGRSNKKRPVSTYDYFSHIHAGAFQDRLNMLMSGPAKVLGDFADRLNSTLAPLSDLSLRLDVPLMPELDAIKQSLAEAGDAIKITEEMERAKEVFDLNYREQLKIYQEQARELQSVLGGERLKQVRELQSALEGLRVSEDLLKLKDQMASISELTHTGISTLIDLSHIQNELDELGNVQRAISSIMESSFNNCRSGIDAIISTDLEKIYSLEPPTYGADLVDLVKASTNNMNKYIKTYIDSGMENVLIREPKLFKDLELNSLIFKDMGYSFHDLTYYRTETTDERDDESDLIEIGQDYDFVELLNELDPKYARQWNGALHALNSDNPDRISQTAHSLRELHDHIIRDYAPEEEVRRYKDIENGVRVERRHRVDYIFKGKSQSEIKLVMSFTDTWLQLVNHHIKICHTGELFPSWLPLESTIKMSRALLFCLGLQIKTSRKN